MHVPFFDIGPTHATIAAELDAAWRAVLDGRQFILGERVSAFESEFAAYCNADHGIGVANGLDALTLILEGLSIGAGDEVIVPAHTFIATWLGVTRTGAKPVPVDCLSNTGNIDPTLVPAAITSRTEANARRVAAARGIERVHRGVEDLVRDPEVDIVDVALPPDLQPPVVMQAIDAALTVESGPHGGTRVSVRTRGLVTP